MENIHSSNAPKAVGSYPHAKKVGSFLFLSGIGPRKAGSKEIPGVVQDEYGHVTSYDLAAQTYSVFENIKAVLLSSGAGLKDVVDVQVFLTNMKEDFETFNKIYSEYFDAKTGPTRTTVQVGALPTPIAVELKVTAYLK